MNAPPPLPHALDDAKPAIFWSREATENELYVVRNRPFLNADKYRLHNENLYSEPVLTAEAMYASEFVDEKEYDVPRGHTHTATLTPTSIYNSTIPLMGWNRFLERAEALNWLASRMWLG